MSKKQTNVIKYIAIAILALLALPIVLALMLGVVHEFGMVALLVGLIGVVGGVWLIKFSFEKFFHLYIRSWVSFSLWFFLTVLIGFIVFSLLNEDLSFKEMRSWGVRGPGSGGGVLILPFAWITMFGISFQKAPASRRAKNALQAEQNEIDELYDQAFYKNDFNALCDLVNMFYEGENQKFFQKSPLQAAKVFEGAQRLVKMVEEGHEKQPELEDYYWLGLMYETGFACPPDPLKAIEYYTKALSTKECWDGDPNHFKNLCKTVQGRIANLQQPNSPRS